MADNHYHFDDQKRHGRLLRASLLKLEEGRNELIGLSDCMTKMIDGDGGDASHFESHVDLFGFTTTAEAKGAYDEIMADVGHLNNIKAALDQLFAKLR